MKYAYRLFLCLLSILCVPQHAKAAEQSPGHPNFLVIVADDLGYSDLGAFGGEIDTPNLDGLAARGVRFSGFHTAPTCSPTRAMLMTGVDNHEVGLGTMAEMATPDQRTHDGYAGFLNKRALTVAERLRTNGYRTMMVGKWHLGTRDDQAPAGRGFDQSFVLLQGAHNHYGLDQYAPYTGGAVVQYRENGQPAHFPLGAFSADYFTDRLIGFLKQPHEADRPFFAYLAFTEPHWPLQAPSGLVAKYRGRYDAGPQDLAGRRFTRMKQLGVIPASAQPHPIDGPAWSSLSADERAVAARKMEVYAAMVDRLDQNVGRVLAALKETGELDNTVIIFMSDNGPEGMEMSRPINHTDPAHPPVVPTDNSLANIGQMNSYVSYGKAWAEASSAPYSGVKSDVFEGGIHTPAIVAGPGVEGGRIVDALLHVTDIVPTLLDLSGTPVGTIGAPPEGRSWTAVLKGSRTTVRTAKDTLAWELFYRRAIRRGDLKAVYRPNVFAIFGGRIDHHAEWQLYDLAADPGETHDIANLHPHQLKSLIAAWEVYANRNKVELLPDAPENIAANKGK